jgi:hypothetical protein
MLGDGHARRTVDGDGPVAGGERPAPVDDRPRAARRVGPGPCAGLVRRRDHEQRVRVVLGPNGLHQGLFDAQELLDGALGPGVVALTVVVLHQSQLLVEQVAGGPAGDLVLAPDLQVRVERDGVLDAQPRHRGADRVGVAGGREILARGRR